MKAYKGFDKDLKCKDFQYEIGKTYEEPKAQLFKKGFHACEYPLDVFGYYPPSCNRFAEVELDEVSNEKSDDSNRCGKKIRVKAEIGIAGIVKASVDYIKEHATSVHDETGYRSAATNTGKDGVASSLGIKGKAKGSLGCWLVLAEWKKVNDEWRRTDVQCRRVDGETVKADTFYCLENGEFVEATDDE